MNFDKYKKDCIFNFCVLRRYIDCIPNEVINHINYLVCGNYMFICNLPMAIDKPGYYCVTKDISYDNINAIEFNANNITIDLCNHTIKGGSKYYSLNAKISIFIL